MPEKIFDLLIDPGETKNLLDSGGLLAPDDRQIFEDLRIKVLYAHKSVLAKEIGNTEGSIPKVLWPKPNQVLSFDTLAGRFYIEWTGDPKASYVLAYEIGEQPFSLSGEMRVTGTRRDFGELDKHYWETWVLPYETARVRIRREGREAWGPWSQYTLK